MSDPHAPDAGSPGPNAAARFELGEIHTDESARAALARAGLTAAPFLQRHSRCDWGLANGRTAARNAISIAKGRGLVASIYELPSGERLSIHTHTSQRLTDIRLRGPDWPEHAEGPDVGPDLPGASRHLFELGKLIATSGALIAIDLAKASVLGLVVRHVTGDWGDLDEHDRAENRRALDVGARVVSVYQLAPRVRVYVITEHDRSRTTLLLPSEY